MSCKALPEMTSHWEVTEPMSCPAMAAPTVAGFATCPLMAIPAGFSGKVVFQSVGFPAGGSWELSTPVTVELF